MPTHSTNTLARLPLDQRNWPIQYENEDGTIGEHAYPINYAELYNLKGRLLTIIDATFTDPQQRKAHKNIVWQTLQAWMQDIEQAAGYDEYTPELALSAETDKPNTQDGTSSA